MCIRDSIYEMNVRRAVSMAVQVILSTWYVVMSIDRCKPLVLVLTSRNLRQVLLSWRRIWTLKCESCIQCDEYSIGHAQLSRLLWYGMRPNCNAKACTTRGMNERLSFRIAFCQVAQRGLSRAAVLLRYALYYCWEWSHYCSIIAEYSQHYMVTYNK